MRRRAPTAQSDSDLVDEMLECYITWREHRTTVQDAYEVWTAAPARERDHAFQTYLATLDREQLAAEDYQRAVERSAAAPLSDGS